jgi:hypothetical protein
MFTSPISQFNKSLSALKEVKIKETLFLRSFTFAKLPLLWWISPSVLEISAENTVLKIPLTRRTKNHLNTMYFGALAMGGEAAVAVRTVFYARKRKVKISFVFKDFTANFLRRAEGDVYFISNEGRGVDELIDLAIQTGQRQEKKFSSYATVPSIDPAQKVAEFTVTLSVKPITKG